MKHRKTHERSKAVRSAVVTLGAAAAVVGAASAASALDSTTAEVGGVSMPDAADPSAAVGTGLNVVHGATDGLPLL